MTVTYRDLYEDINPIDFLFGDEKLTVPQSRFTPELTVGFFERTMQMVDMKALHAMSDDNPNGLVSLPALLRYEANRNYGKQWLRLEATKEMIVGSGLPDGTPYQLLYFPIYSFPTPGWKDIPTVEMEGDDRWRFGRHVLGNVSADALLFGKNESLYFATAEWEPIQEYFARDEVPRYLDADQEPYTFSLCQLSIERVKWKDKRILARIADGTWGDTSSFRAGVQLLLGGTAEILESRARSMRFVADKLEAMSIYYGR